MKRTFALNITVSALATAALCTLSACVTAPKGAVEAQAAQVKVYRPDQLLPDQYEHVRYFWADSWRSAFWLPSAASETDGIASLQAAAARVGANGLINAGCIDQGYFLRPRSGKPSIVCYGHAIRVR